MPNRPLRMLLLQLWSHLSRRRQLQFAMVLGLMLISAFAEMLTLGAILPFLAILVDPAKATGVGFVYSFTSWLNSVYSLNTQLSISIIFAMTAVFAAAVRMMMLWCSSRLAYASGSDISFDVYKRTLYQPYLVHVSRNSSEVSSGLDYKVSYAVNVLLQMLNFVSSLVMMLALMAALLVIDAKIASLASIGFGFGYLLISWSFRKRLILNSRRISRESTQVVKAVQEGLGGIRDVLLSGSQPFYCDVYRRADFPLRLAMGNNIFIAGSPRFLMEALGIVLIIILAYMFCLRPEGGSSVLPVLGALALGAQRLLPSLQQCYASWASILGSRTALEETLAFLEQPLPDELLLPPPPPIPVQACIQFDSVCFRYNASNPKVIDNLTFAIPKGSRVGIVGGTGSGKSTLLDLLMGLIEPECGNVLVDGQSIAGTRLRAWQQAIAHVPQNIYLADATLAENIAFGVPRSEIDMDRVKSAAQRAMIADFVEKQPEGYDIFVGERGVRLSGGQRQRVGIARALYKQATVLIFDEATSALDNATEQDVMRAIEGLNRELTVVIVAHRLSTVKRCDNIIELKNGRLEAQGTYDYLLDNSQSFRSMVMAAEHS